MLRAITQRDHPLNGGTWGAPLFRGGETNHGMLDSPSGGIKILPRAAQNPLSGAVPEIPGDDKVPEYLP
jgi:hypothetical protein